MKEDFDELKDLMDEVVEGSRKLRLAEEELARLRLALDQATRRTMIVIGERAWRVQGEVMYHDPEKDCPELYRYLSEKGLVAKS